MWKKLWGLLAGPLNRNFILLLIVINFLGSIYGYYWYAGQLAESPPRYILFVPDSPLSTTLFTLMLILILVNKRNSLLEMLACAGVIKYGIWAAVINIHYGLTFSYFDIVNFGLTAGHLGMAAEGIVFLRHVRINNALIGITLGWMVLNDFMDYVVGVHPYLFDDKQWGVALGTAIVLTAGISAFHIYLSRKADKSLCKANA